LRGGDWKSLIPKLATKIIAARISLVTADKRLIFLSHIATLNLAPARLMELNQLILTLPINKNFNQLIFAINPQS